MSGDTGVRLSSVALAALVCGGLSWMALGWWRSTGAQVPAMPWLGLLPLGMAAVLVLVAGWRVRRYSRSSLAGPAGRELTPQQARATLVAAQASALAGGMLLGWYLANAVHHLGNADVPSVQRMLLSALASAVAAGLLAAAGLAAQAMCRIPPEDEDG